MMTAGDGMVLCPKEPGGFYRWQQNGYVKEGIKSYEIRCLQYFV